MSKDWADNRTRRRGGPAAPMESELGVFVGKDLGLACPEGVSYLQAVGGVGGAKFAGLDEEGEESGEKQEQGNRMRGSEGGALVSMGTCAVGETNEWASLAGLFSSLGVAHFRARLVAAAGGLGGI